MLPYTDLLPYQVCLISRFVTLSLLVVLSRFVIVFKFYHHLSYTTIFQFVQLLGRDLKSKISLEVILYLLYIDLYIMRRNTRKYIKVLF